MALRAANKEGAKVAVGRGVAGLGAVEKVEGLVAAALVAGQMEATGVTVAAEEVTVAAVRVGARVGAKAAVVTEVGLEAAMEEVVMVEEARAAVAPEAVMAVGVTEAVREAEMVAVVMVVWKVVQRAVMASKVEAVMEGETRVAMMGMDWED